MIPIIPKDEKDHLDKTFGFGNFLTANAGFYRVTVSFLIRIIRSQQVSIWVQIIHPIKNYFYYPKNGYK